MNDDFFLDPAIGRKSKLVNDALHLVDGWPLPSVVEISESGTCNRKCVFCPRSSSDYKDVKEFIDPELINKLVSELAEFSYSGIVLFSGFVEPLCLINRYIITLRLFVLIYHKRGLKW